MKNIWLNDDVIKCYLALDLTAFAEAFPAQMETKHKAFKFLV